MKVLDPGHLYELNNLMSNTKSELRFMKDWEIHGDGYEGTYCQEVLRAIIDRVETLNAERPWSGNDQIIFHARMMIAGFEARALIRRVEKNNLQIEKLPVAPDGHIYMSLTDLMKLMEESK